MSLPSIPILHVQRLASGEADGDRASEFDGFARLVEALDDEEIRPPSFASLLRGRLAESGLDHPGLLTLADPRRNRLDAWCRRLGPLGWSSIWSTALDSLDTPGSVAAETLGMLAGQGVVVASRGVSGDPLVAMDVGRLREELTRSRRRLSELCGYQVRWLVPPTTPTGRAADALVVDEARRAGYTRVLTPGWAHADPDSDPTAPLPMLVLDDVDSIDAALRWIRNRPGAGVETRVRSLLQRPKRLLDGALRPDDD